VTGRVAVISYRSGNVRSVVNALRQLDVECIVTSERSDLERAWRIILPGVGEARSAMEALEQASLVDWIRDTQIPFLGICLGMQVLFERSEERSTTGLGLIPGTIARFESDGTLKIPHMGWNTIQHDASSPLFNGISLDEYFYFVHSYRAPLTDATIGRTDYGGFFSSAVSVRNYYGVQFHPEKSGSAGLRLLRNFIERC